MDLDLAGLVFKFSFHFVVFTLLFSLQTLAQSEAWTSPACRSGLMNHHLRLSAQVSLPTSNEFTCHLLHQRILRSPARSQKICTCNTTRTQLLLWSGPSRYQVELRCTVNMDTAFDDWQVAQSWTTTTPDLQSTQLSCEKARKNQEPIDSNDACAAWINANFLTSSAEGRIGVVSTPKQHQIRLQGEWQTDSQPSRSTHETITSRLNGIDQHVRFEVTYTADHQIQSLRRVHFTNIQMIPFGRRTRSPDSWEEIRFDHNGNSCRPAQFLNSQGNTFEMVSCSRSVTPCQSVTERECFVQRTHYRLCKNFQNFYFDSTSTTQNTQTPPPQTTSEGRK